MTILHKKEWFEHYDTLTDGEKGSTFIDCYSKPKGIFFEVSEVNGISILTHNDKIYDEDPISRALVDAGYTGRIVVSVGGMANGQIPRWLAYNIIHHREATTVKQRMWLQRITVYTFSQVPGACKIETRTINPTTLPMTEIISANGMKSTTEDYDGLCFDYNGDFYHILPSRSMEGEVRSIKDNQLIVLVDLPVGKRAVKSKWWGDNPPPLELLGSKVRVRYTEKLAGRCVNNLMSATVMSDESRGGAVC